MSLAPIALFGYKRPEHLTRTLKALRASPLARASELHVFSDGPKQLGIQCQGLELFWHIGREISAGGGFSH